MADGTSPTDGMFYSKDGSYTGQVSVSASKVDLEEGDYTNYDSSTDTLKQKAINLGELSELGATNLLTASNISNQLKALEIEATLKSAELIQNSNITLAKAITNSALGIKASMNESALQTDGMMTMQGEIYLQLQDLNKNIQKLTTATGNQNLTLNTSSIETVLNSGIQNQILTNSKIVEGINSQNKVNEKQLTKLEQELNNDISINGNNVNSIELEKMKNKELYQSASDENNFTLNEGLEAVEDILTDGFDLDFNPLKQLLELLQEDYTKELKDIEVKYNLKGVE